MSRKLFGMGIACLLAVFSLMGAPQAAKAQTGNFAYIGFEYDYGSLGQYDMLKGGVDTAMDIYWHYIYDNPLQRWVYVTLYASIAYKNSGGSTISTGDVSIDTVCPWADSDGDNMSDGVCFGTYLESAIMADRHWILDYAYDTIQGNGSLSACTQVTVTYYVKPKMAWYDNQDQWHETVVDTDYISGSWSGNPWPYYP
jgi:hypothetical protein